MATKEQILAEVQRQFNQAGLGDAVPAAMKIVASESGGSGSAKNPKSTAQGFFQWTTPTAKSYGVIRGDLQSEVAGLTKMMKDHQRAGLNVANVGEFAVGHQFGTVGGSMIKKAAMRDPNTPLVDVLAQVYSKKKNPMGYAQYVASINKLNGATVGDVLNRKSTAGIGNSGGYIADNQQDYQPQEYQPQDFQAQDYSNQNDMSQQQNNELNIGKGYNQQVQIPQVAQRIESPQALDAIYTPQTNLSANSIRDMPSNGDILPDDINSLIESIYNDV